MTSPLSRAFASAKREGRAVLVGYLPAGFPSLAGSVRAVTAMVEGGVDVVEVGLPYSDPLMDGPVIQQAVDRALAAGTRVADVLDVVQEVAATGAPTLVMTYWNPVERSGVGDFAARLAEAGGAGLITPDLIPDEAGEWLAAAEQNSLDRVFLVAPSSTEARIRAVGQASRGFVYAASTMGVTGTREEVGRLAPALVARTRALVDLPVAVGLGVGSREQAAAVAAFADGVIVGSAFVARLLEAPDEASGIEAVRALAGELAAGVRG
jgi:tryptophan synthase alpha chain